MKSYQEILDNYIPYHRNKINILIHKITVPLLFISGYGLLSKIPVPAGEGYWNFGYLVFAALIVYLLNFGMKKLSVMAVFLLAVILIVAQLNARFENILPVYAVAFVGCWVLQFYGHYVEGRKPAFINDLHAFPLGLVLAYEKKRN